MTSSEPFSWIPLFYVLGDDYIFRKKLPVVPRKKFGSGDCDTIFTISILPSLHDHVILRLTLCFDNPQTSSCYKLSKPLICTLFASSLKTHTITYFSILGVKTNLMNYLVQLISSKRYLECTLVQWILSIYLWCTQVAGGTFSM